MRGRVSRAATTPSLDLDSPAMSSAASSDYQPDSPGGVDDLIVVTSSRRRARSDPDNEPRDDTDGPVRKKKKAPVRRDPERRKQQNRTAQRKLRERKENHTKELETRIEALEQIIQRQADTQTELESTIHRLRAENASLLSGSRAGSSRHTPDLVSTPSPPPFLFMPSLPQDGAGPSIELPAAPFVPPAGAPDWLLHPMPKRPSLPPSVGAPNMSNSWWWI